MIRFKKFITEIKRDDWFGPPQGGPDPSLWEIVPELLLPNVIEPVPPQSAGDPVGDAFDSNYPYGTPPWWNDYPNSSPYGWGNCHGEPCWEFDEQGFIVPKNPWAYPPPGWWVDDYGNWHKEDIPDYRPKRGYHWRWNEFTNTWEQTPTEFEDSDFDIYDLPCFNCNPIDFNNPPTQPEVPSERDFAPYPGGRPQM